MSKQYADGYQAALLDINNAILDGGLDAATLWIMDNLHKPERDYELEALIAQLKSYAAEHYEQDGWDVFVEAWDDDMIKREIGKSRSFGYARWKIAKSLKIYDDHRSEIEATADMREIQGMHCQQCGNANAEDVRSRAYSGCCNERVVPAGFCSASTGCSHR